MMFRIALWSVLAAWAVLPAHLLWGQQPMRPLASEPRVRTGVDDESPVDPERAEVVALPPGDPAPADWLSSGLPEASARCTGLGQPLQGTSWLNRPVYVGGFLGNSLGTTLVSGQVDLEPELLWGAWLGYDFSHYWGSELRLAFNYAELTVLPQGTSGGNSRGTLADINLLYYPWGDARWRPYGAVGVGLGGFRYTTTADPAGHHTGLAIPLGLGVKYLWGKRWAFRFDVKDNIVFGGDDVSTTHTWSLLGGIEFHWGRTSAAQYYPWW
jgi:hypothetical protein